MAEVQRRQGGLEMVHVPGHEQKEWIVQRIGWGVMLLLCMAALAGVLGDGPASGAREGRVGDDLYLDYDRFLRHQATSTVKVFCKPTAGTEFTLAFTRAFLDKHEIREIQPEPASTVIEGRKCVYHFKGKSGEEQLVTFRLE